MAFMQPTHPVCPYERNKEDEDELMILTEGVVRTYSNNNVADPNGENSKRKTGIDAVIGRMIDAVIAHENVRCKVLFWGRFYLLGNVAMLVILKEDLMVSS